MTGLCGVIGRREHAIEPMAADVAWTGAERQVDYADEYLSIRGSFLDAGDQPVAAEGGDVLVWVWGELYGADGPDGYVPRPFDGESTAAYWADLHDAHGVDAVGGLNGEFVGVLYDRAARTVSLCTDRLAMRDTYVTRPSDGSLAFSTRMQSLSLLPDVTPAFDPEILGEYLVLRRTFGVETPLRGIRMLPPGTVTTVDLDTCELRTERYWSPRYRPLDRPFSYFVDEFVDRFRAAMVDRTRTPGEYGVLLSGGSDSRLVLAGLAERVDPTAYHMTDWMNAESRTAERAALTAGAAFEPLRRGPDYHARALRRTPALSNFIGTFNQAHAEGFMDRLRTEVDVLFDGNFADAIFNGNHLPKRELSLGPIGSVALPLPKPIGGIDDYLDYWARPSPPYLTRPRDIRSVLSDRIRAANGTVRHHGIAYASPRDLFVCAPIVPRTNGSIFSAQSIRQHVAHGNPFVDNRLVDLALSIPTRYLFWRSLANAALRRMAPDLAAIPHAGSGVPPSRFYPAHYVGGRVVERLRERQPPPHPDLSHGPWPNYPALIRSHPFVEEALDEHESTIRRLPFLDWSGALDCYRDHLDGADRSDELYRLLTVLEMPVTERIVEARAP